ncbi:hypothetical protein J1605_014180 [Eschrichtius robustus]|uniref:Uncharacterized protein n=1 Tax=Eschrichtius robustus TaxID=9764 RepID=A0AB34GCS2_ESCRO|nr:hypothetical protein J1605_014180 [Eschrichtius robustus]
MRPKQGPPGETKQQNTTASLRFFVIWKNRAGAPCRSPAPKTPLRAGFNPKVLGSRAGPAWCAAPDAARRAQTRQGRFSSAHLILPRCSGFAGRGLCGDIKNSQENPRPSLQPLRPAAVGLHYLFPRRTALGKMKPCAVS